MFQSTLPRGERRLAFFPFPLVQNVSIHAPARGATALGLVWGGRFKKFQSTLPRGERLRLIAGQKGGACFNPRSRAGSDDYFHAADAVAVVFQSTLPRGERPRGPEVYLELVCVSIHAPARGATVKLKLFKFKAQNYYNARTCLYVPANPIVVKEQLPKYMFFQTL